MASSFSQTVRVQKAFPVSRRTATARQPISDFACPAGINPKLIALAAKFDKAETEFGRVLLEVIAPTEQLLFANREDKAAKAAVKEARWLEDKACAASARAAKKFSAVRATNLEELVLKAR